MKRKVDTDWFMERIRESRWGSQMQLAPEITDRRGNPLDQPELSRMLRGQREMQMSEAAQLSKLLGVPLAEIFRRVGIPVDDVPTVKKKR